MIVPEFIQGRFYVVQAIRNSKHGFTEKDDCNAGDGIVLKNDP